MSLREERDVFVRKHLVSDQRLFFLPSMNNPGE